MFRLLFQYIGMDVPSWKDNENLDHLREQRLTMLHWADANSIRFVLAPMIQNISKEKDGRYRTTAE